MTGKLILTIALGAIVVAGMIGRLARRIVSSSNRSEPERPPSRRRSRAYRMPELTADVVERELTIFVPVSHLNDPDLTSRVIDACGLPIGM